MATLPQNSSPYPDPKELSPTTTEQTEQAEQTEPPTTTALQTTLANEFKLLKIKRNICPCCGQGVNRSNDREEYQKYLRSLACDFILKHWYGYRHEYSKEQEAFIAKSVSSSPYIFDGYATSHPKIFDVSNKTIDPIDPEVRIMADLTNPRTTSAGAHYAAAALLLRADLKEKISWCHNKLEDLFLAIDELGQALTWANRSELADWINQQKAGWKIKCRMGSFTFATIDNNKTGMYHVTWYSQYDYKAIGRGEFLTTEELLNTIFSYAALFL